MLLQWGLIVHKSSSEWNNCLLLNSQGAYLHRQEREGREPEARERNNEEREKSNRKYLSAPWIIYPPHCSGWIPAGSVQSSIGLLFMCSAISQQPCSVCRAWEDGGKRGGAARHRGPVNGWLQKSWRKKSSGEFYSFPAVLFEQCRASYWNQ